MGVERFALPPGTCTAVSRHVANSGGFRQRIKDGRGTSSATPRHLPFGGISPSS